jgi:hypothetical protein
VKYIEGKGTAACQVPKSVCCSYDSNFKMMVVKCAGETKSLAVNLEIPHCSTIYSAREEEGWGLLLKGVNSI